MQAAPFPPRVPDIYALFHPHHLHWNIQNSFYISSCSNKRWHRSNVGHWRLHFYRTYHMIQTLHHRFIGVDRGALSCQAARICFANQAGNTPFCSPIWCLNLLAHRVAESGLVAVPHSESHNFLSVHTHGVDNHPDSKSTSCTICIRKQPPDIHWGRFFCLESCKFHLSATRQ